jgi:hypothetical protein
MKVNCNDDESQELCFIINKFVKSSTYIKVNQIEFSKIMISRRLHIGSPMVQIESNCLKIKGSDIFGYNHISIGTRYIYEDSWDGSGDERLYTEIRRWYDNRLQKRRDIKLNELGI